MTDQRDQRREQVRDAILDAAIELVARRGFDNVSLREIARQVGYSPAGLYEYFSGKEDIFEAVIEEVFYRFSEALQGVPADAARGAYLVEFCLAYLEFARTYPQYYQLMFSRTYQPGTGDSPVGEHRTMKLFKDAVKTAGQGGDAPIRADLSAEVTAYALWALSHGMAMLQITHLRELGAVLSMIDRTVLGVLVKGLTGQA